AQHGLAQYRLVKQLVAVRIFRPRFEMGGVNSARVEIALTLERQQLLTPRVIGDEIDFPAWRRVAADPDLLLARQIDLDAGADPITLGPEYFCRQLLKRIHARSCR